MPCAAARSVNAPYNDVGGDYIDPWQPQPGWFHSASPLRPQTLSTTHTFSLFAANRLQLSDRLSLVTGVCRDQNHIDRDNLTNDSRSDRSLQGGNWRVGLVYALSDNHNLFDREYVQSAFSGQQWLMGMPRSYFATVDYSF